MQKHTTLMFMRRTDLLKTCCGGPCGPQRPSLHSPSLGAAGAFCFVFNMDEYIHIN